MGEGYGCAGVWCAGGVLQFQAVPSGGVCNLVQICPTRRISIAVVHVGWGQWAQRGYYRTTSPLLQFPPHRGDRHFDKKA